MSRVILVTFDGAQTLDVTGPAEVFAAAGRALDEPVYSLRFASVGGGERSTSSSLRVQTVDLLRTRARPSDVIIVAGGEEQPVRAAATNTALLRWLGRAAGVARRMASVCSGAFILAAAGLLDGKCATTHWSACDFLARNFPRTKVDANAIFVRDGSIWTSAGVTTGIDMALAMVEEDLGRKVADRIAAQLVLYLRRPGFQSQFSEALVAQTERGDPLGPAIAWARAHLRTVSIDTLAKRAGLSVRTLHRRCLEVLGTTPAKLVAKLRVEHARTLLTSTTRPAKALAAECGFGSSARMSRAFEQELGMSPSEYRVMHANGKSRSQNRTSQRAAAARRELHVLGALGRASGVLRGPE